MINKGQTMNVTVTARKKGQQFSLQNQMGITVNETVTKKALTQALKENFLEEINKPLKNNFYTMDDVKVKYN